MMTAAFCVDIPQVKIDTIRDRIRTFNWFSPPADEGLSWSRGINMVFLKELCDYWLNSYEWRTQELELNRFPQFIENIQGLDIHFVHLLGEAGGQRPLILTHGWPGSHFEFWASIEKLAFPTRFGGASGDAFDIVIPSLPGYGFSGKPTTPVGQNATASLWNELMTKVLGYPRYLAQGGDWGSLVTSFLGLNHPACVGVHLNMVPFQPADATPRSSQEEAWLIGLERKLRAEGAYQLEQMTKPQTLAMALMDSPVGAAAWILEKFHGWSDLGGKNLESVYTKDQLITNVMIYLVNDALATSLWYYRAYEEEAAARLGVGQRVETPTGVANFTGEPVFGIPPRSWVERLYNVVHWTDLGKGGHFGAMEQPESFAADVQDFARVIGF